MTNPGRSAKRRLLIIVTSLAIFATACGGGGSSADPAVSAAAQSNEAQLVLTDDIGATQLLDSNSGEITSLGEVVTGDRAVLVWYWAPH